MTARAARLRQSGHDIISLGAGAPDFETPDHINEAAFAAIRAGQTKYTAVDGSHALELAVIAKFERDNGLTFQSDEVLISSGGKQSLNNGCQAILNDGDEVIIPAPYWVSFPDMVRLANAQPVIVPTTAATGFRLTPESLAGAITPRTRAIIVNSPCNPTGSAYTRTHWEAIGERLLEQRGVALVPGSAFGSPGHVRLSFATGMESLRAALDRLHLFVH